MGRFTRFLLAALVATSLCGVLYARQVVPAADPPSPASTLTPTVPTAVPVNPPVVPPVNPPAPTPVAPPAVTTTVVPVATVVAAVDASDTALAAARQQVASLEQQLATARAALQKLQQQSGHNATLAAVLKHHHGAFIYNKNVYSTGAANKITVTPAPEDLTGKSVSITTDAAGAITGVATVAPTVPPVTDGNGTVTPTPAAK